jgi:peptidyl-prolyl cis-trans isomerase D
MLEYFRSRRNPIVLYFITGLICLVMLSFGVVLTQYGTPSTWILKIENQKVPMKYFMASYQQMIAYFQSMMQGQFNPSFLQFFPVDQMVINNLKEQELVSHWAERIQFYYSPQFVRERILEQEAFKDAGGFSFDRYKNFLARGTVLSPISPKHYESHVGKSYLVQSLGRSIRDSVRLTDRQKTYLTTLRKTEYELDLFPLKADQLNTEPKVSPEEIQAFADNSDNLALLQNAYFAHIDRYKTKDSFKAKHILISVSESASAEEKSKALEQAKSLHQKLTANPSQFEALAKAHSNDPGSKDKGGDLGTFASGDMVKPFEDALRQLEPGAISEPVESPFGYHLIQSVAFVPGKTTDLDAVKSELAKEVLIRQRREEMIQIQRPILSELLSSQKTREVDHILKTSLSVKPTPSGWISVYQDEIEALGKGVSAYPLKKILRDGREGLTANTYLPELVTLNAVPYVVKVKKIQEAFSETGQEKGMEQFVDQMQTKWQDHVYTAFKMQLEELYRVEINKEALESLKKQSPSGSEAEGIPEEG